MIGQNLHCFWASQSLFVMTDQPVRVCFQPVLALEGVEC